ncbi:G protein-regulated inducer of neurite outgrowth 1 isoform X1 [Anolis sagrei]|uniref:G protein-regulated inducer of neurite outgrowth 1 isoform X1 n=2 Tax=Anolis sagrei TaxID=38937 RepID=UPI003520FF8E
MWPRRDAFLFESGVSRLPSEGEKERSLRKSPPREAHGVVWQKSHLDMGSAKEPETLQFLKQEVVSEDAHQPSSHCSPQKDRCLQNLQCDGGHLAMRNCCIHDLSTKESSQDNTMVDNPYQKDKSPAANLKPSDDQHATTDTIVLKDISPGGTPLGVEGEQSASHELCHNNQQGLSLTEPPGNPANTCSPLETKVSPVTGEACRHPLPESSLKEDHKDSASTPSSSKHVGFVESSKDKDETDSFTAGTGHSKESPALRACLKNTCQGQLHDSSGDLPNSSHDICGTAGPFSEGHRDPLVLGTTKESVTEPFETEGTPGESNKPVTESHQLGQSGEIKSVALDSKTGRDSGIALGVPIAIIPCDVQTQDLTPGELQATPDKATKEPERLREAAPDDAKGQNQAQEQQRPEAGCTATRKEHTTAVETRHEEPLVKSCLIEVTPSQHDAGTQAGNRVSLVSVAISPINPPDGSAAFTFHGRGLGAPSLMSPGPEQKPAKKDVEMQVSIPVETRSVATGPMTPITKSPQASYPEVHVKGAQEETPEPVKEVSWDEKGMTWEVYGASMEVEVLGMAIQKHLEKQIEEHGRQVVMTPQSTRSSSIKGAPQKAEIKRQPSVFRSLLQNVRRPRCCSRGGPAVE